MDIHLLQRKKKSRENGWLITKKHGRWVGAETEWKKACLDAARHEKLCFALQKPSVLSQPGYKTKEGPQGVVIRPRVLDDIAHPHEYRIRKQAQNDFKNNFYKLVNVSVFGKTIDNMRKRVNTKIVRSDKKEKIRKLIASPLFTGCTLFSNHLAGFRMHKACVKLNKPVFFIYDFYYNHLKSGSTVLNESFSIPTQRAFCLRYRSTTWKVTNTCTTHVITPKSPPP